MVNHDALLWSIESETDCIVLDPSRHGYEDCRKVFNSSIDRRPSAIIRPRSTEDVEQVVGRLIDAGVGYTLRAGGHSIAGTSVRDGLVMLDLSLLRKVSYDDRSGVASVEAGALWCDYDAVTSRFGMASTGGIVSHTGVAGLTLGGGLGWLMGIAGLACDTLIGVSAIDSSGRTREIGEGDASLRAFRGAGRSLGVVTEMRFRPIAIPSTVTAGRAVLDLSQATALLQSCLRESVAGPDWLTVSPSLLWTEGRWCAVLDFVATMDQSQTIDAVARGYGVVPSSIVETSYVDAQRKLDTALRFGRRNYWKSLAMTSIDDQCVEDLVRHLEQSPSRQSFISVDVLHGAASSEPPGGSSFRIRNRPLVVLFNTIWEGESADKDNLNWTREAYRILRDASIDDCTYSNYFSHDDVGAQSGSESDPDEDILRTWRVPGLT